MKSSGKQASFSEDALIAEPTTSWAVDLLVHANGPDTRKTADYSPRQAHALSELQALRRAAHLGEQQKLRHGSIAKIQKPSVRQFEPVGNYAAPLAPLRERDLKALDSLFDRPDMAAIEFDIKQRLLHLFPEPCWEEDVFEFLKDFL